MEKLPSNLIIDEILSRLDLETLCTVACASKSFRFSVDRHLLPSLSSLDLPSSLIPDDISLHHILSRCSNAADLSLNCQRLRDSFFPPFLSAHITQLNLYCCSSLSSRIFVSVAQKCPFLRVLMLEFADQDSSHLFETKFVYLLKRCDLLECLCIKTRGAELSGINAFRSIGGLLPKTIKTLKLKPVFEENAFGLVNKLGADGTHSAYQDLRIPVSPSQSLIGLQSLSLALDVISDRLVITIACALPLLQELELEDGPYKETVPSCDLTDVGLQSLSSCHRLTALALIRHRENCQGSFKRVTDIGMFLLSEGCKGLESVKLCGFSKVSAAGFASLLQSCQKLKKFEIRKAALLSDLAFYNLVVATLSEVRLLSCNLITSETVKNLSSSKSLEALDLCGCKSIADSCLYSVSLLQNLTSLNLTGADITDKGISVLGQGSSPISRLSLRGCKRVTDKGISHLLNGGGAIAQRLAVLDLGYMPGISDNAILTIAASGKEITELCIRCCFYVTDSSIRALANKRRLEDGSKEIKQLDLFSCIGLSGDSLELLRKPLFRGLHWVGIGQTRMGSMRGGVMAEIHEERPWLIVCLDGCEMGCHDGWQFHYRF